MLLSTTILVELHDLFVPGVTGRIIERFSESHQTQIFDSCERNPANYPDIAFLTSTGRAIAVSEFRGAPQQWAYLVPNSS
jgi:hypothetical protein